MKQKKQPNPKGKRLRPATGLQLIELMFAISLTGLLAVTLSASLAQTIQASQNAEANMLPSFYAQAMIDRLRAIPYPVKSTIFGNTVYGLSSIPAGTYQIPINSDDGVQSSLQAPIQNTPLAVDLTNYVYSQGGGSGPPYEFKGVATVTITPGPTDATSGLPLYVQVTSTVTWPPNSSSPRTYQTTTVIAESGLHG
ncbi:MAG TPA: hypothetical protein V6C86_04390 [Oculatellaceae cyanobacterium]